MKSAVAKHSIEIAGRKTSVSLEEVFWTGLKEIAGERHLALGSLVQEIDVSRWPQGNLSSALRTHVLDYYKQKSFGGDTGIAPALADRNARL